MRDAGVIFVFFFSSDKADQSLFNPCYCCTLLFYAIFRVGFLYAVIGSRSRTTFVSIDFGTIIWVRADGRFVVW